MHGKVTIFLVISVDILKIVFAIRNDISYGKISIQRNFAPEANPYFKRM